MGVMKGCVPPSTAVYGLHQIFDELFNFFAMCKYEAQGLN